MSNKNQNKQYKIKLKFFHCQTPGRLNASSITHSHKTKQAPQTAQTSVPSGAPAQATKSNLNPVVESIHKILSHIQPGFPGQHLLLPHKMYLISIVLTKLERHRKSDLVKSLSTVLCAGLFINVYGSRIKTFHPDERYR